MPEYTLKCDKCNHIFTKVWKISEYDEKFKNVKCKQCKSRKIYREYSQDSVVPNYIKSLHECSTLGEYAEKQSKKYGKAKCEAMERSFVTQQEPESGIKELPTGMSRVKEDKDLARYMEKDEIKNRRKKEK